MKHNLLFTFITCLSVSNAAQAAQPMQRVMQRVQALPHALNNIAQNTMHTIHQGASNIAHDFREQPLSYIGSVASMTLITAIDAALTTLPSAAESFLHPLAPLFMTLNIYQKIAGVLLAYIRNFILIYTTIHANSRANTAAQRHITMLETALAAHDWQEVERIIQLHDSINATTINDLFTTPIDMNNPALAPRTPEETAQYEQCKAIQLHGVAFTLLHLLIIRKTINEEELCTNNPQMQTFCTAFHGLLDLQTFVAMNNNPQTRNASGLAGTIPAMGEIAGFMAGETGEGIIANQEHHAESSTAARITNNQTHQQHRSRFFDNMSQHA